MNVQLPDVLTVLQAVLSRAGAEDFYQLSLDKEELRDEQDVLQSGFENRAALKPFELRVEASSAHLHTLIQTANNLTQKGRKTQAILVNACKALQFKRGEARRPDSPDPVVTGAVATITTTIEGCMTFLVLFSGGASISEAIGFGLLFAGIGTALAHIFGFHGLRRINYRFLPELEVQSNIPKKRRQKGRRISALCLALIGMLVFAAARLRATGDLEDTFNFGEIGLLATFDDGMAIALIAMAFVTTCLNTWQGLTGWRDRAYGFEEPFGDLAEHEEAVLDQIDELQGIADETADKASDALFERRDLFQNYIDNPPETVERLMSDIRKHNVEVLAALEDELRFQHIQNGIRSLEDTPTIGVTDIDGAFKGLLIPEKDMSNGDDAIEQAHSAIAVIDDLLGCVEAAQADAIAKIELAASEFCADGAVLGSQVLQ